MSKRSKSQQNSNLISQSTLWDYEDNNHSIPLINSVILSYIDTANKESKMENLIDNTSFNFIKNDYNAFLFGLISDQSVKVETAWSLPYKLSIRLGHFDIRKIANLPIEELTTILENTPALHRYPSKIAQYIVAAANLLIKKYDSQASGIWNAVPSAKTVIARFEEFYGIGHKKASLGVMLLIRDFGIKLGNIESVDIAYDVHIRRIFSRVGLVTKDSEEQVYRAARLIYPDYPGALTTPFWSIGRNWCHAVLPNCRECPLKQPCIRKGIEVINE